eukprot:5857695-Alexandrium_andersonii.AAC.1
MPPKPMQAARRKHPPTPAISRQQTRQERASRGTGHAAAAHAIAEHKRSAHAMQLGGVGEGIPQRRD